MRHKEEIEQIDLIQGESSMLFVLLRENVSDYTAYSGTAVLKDGSGNTVISEAMNNTSAQLQYFLTKEQIDGLNVERYILTLNLISGTWSRKKRYFINIKAD
jgi:hypothetical protein